jgi:hypothetical protein
MVESAGLLGFVRETDFPPTGIGYRRLALVCALPANGDSPGYHLIWDVPSELSDVLENRAKLLVVQGSDVARLVNLEGIYCGEPSGVSIDDLAVIEFSLWPRVSNEDSYFAAYWNRRRKPARESEAGLSAVILSHLGKGRPNDYSLDDEEIDVIFSPEDGWSFVEALIRVLSGHIPVVHQTNG